MVYYQLVTTQTSAHVEAQASLTFRCGSMHYTSIEVRLRELYALNVAKSKSHFQA